MAKTMAKPLPKPKFEKTTPPARTHPYMTTRPYGEDQFHRTYPEALSSMASDVKKIRATWVRMGIEDGKRACDVALKQISNLGMNGGPVHAVIDPYTGTTYKAELLRRTDMG